ncbi:MAG: hypothetical protein WCD37_16150, partial [Chloroflexia bacterium]
IDDPTYYSRRYLVEPLEERTRTNYGLPTQMLLEQDATKANLLDACQALHPALVFTASHGLMASGQSLEVQQAVNGALCCHRADETKPLSDWLLTAADFPSNEPFLEGAIVFQFACFGYGTPAESDLNHWLGGPLQNAPASFIAAIPKKLLANPNGPIAFISHLDKALLAGFDDPQQPEPPAKQSWNSRLSPFAQALDELLQSLRPSGLALRPMADRYNSNNAWLTTVDDRLQRLRRRNVPVPSDIQIQMADAFTFRTDAQNYMIFGDPAARLDLPGGPQPTTHSPQQEEVAPGGSP